MNYDLIWKVLRCMVLSLCINKAVETTPRAVSEDANIIIIRKFDWETKKNQEKFF